MTDLGPAHWAVLAAAHTALRATAERVRPDQLGASTPCHLWSVAQVLQHAAGDQLAYAAALTGGPGPQDNPFEPSGRLAGPVLDLVDPALSAAATAFASVPPDATLVPNPLPQGPMAADLVAGACALDAAVHAWDVAVATGQPNPLSAELAGPLLRVARQIVEPLRLYGAYAPARSEQPGDDVRATLLRYLGRDPEWTP